MATVRTVTVKASAGDYASLNAAFSGESGDLVSLDRLLRIDCYAFEDTTAAGTGTGYMTDATRRVEVVAHEAHGGSWSTSAYRLHYSSATHVSQAIYTTVQYIRFQGLQIELTPLTNDYTCLYGIYASHHQSASAVGDVRVSGCIIKLTSALAHPQMTAFLGLYVNYDYWAYNNLVYGETSFLDNSGGGMFQFSRNTAGTAYVFNNTVIGPGANITGIRCGTTDFVLAENNLLKGCGTACSGTFATGSGYNATDLASMGYTVTGGATGDRVSQTFTFAAGSSNYHLASNDAGARDYGADLSASFTIDIDGQTRSGSWDIGCDEYVSAGGMTYEVAATVSAAAACASSAVASLLASVTCSAAAGVTDGAVATYPNALALAVVSALSGAASLTRSGAAALPATASLTSADVLLALAAASLLSSSSVGAGAGLTAAAGASLPAGAGLSADPSLSAAVSAVLAATAAITPGTLAALLASVTLPAAAGTTSVAGLSAVAATGLGGTAGLSSGAALVGLAAAHLAGNATLWVGFGGQILESLTLSSTAGLDAASLAALADDLAVEARAALAVASQQVAQVLVALGVAADVSAQSQAILEAALALAASSVLRASEGLNTIDPQLIRLVAVALTAARLSSAAVGGATLTSVSVTTPGLTGISME